MSSRQTYLLNNKPVTGEPVKVKNTSEPWAEYTLADGTTVKAKLVLLEVVRLDEFGPTGDPLYQFQFQNIVGVTTAPELKKSVPLPSSSKPVQ